MGMSEVFEKCVLPKNSNSQHSLQSCSYSSLLRKAFSFSVMWKQTPAQAAPSPSTPVLSEWAERFAISTQINP